jgi:hypothetical protein
MHLEVKAREVAWCAVLRRSIGNFTGQIAGFFEHGIFHGITTCHNK